MPRALRCLPAVPWQEGAAAAAQAWQLLGISRWLWEDLVLPKCPAQPSSGVVCCLSSCRDCPGHDARHQPGHGHVLGHIALERHGDHGEWHLQGSLHPCSASICWCLTAWHAQSGQSCLQKAPSLLPLLACLCFSHEEIAAPDGQPFGGDLQRSPAHAAAAARLCPQACSWGCVLGGASKPRQGSTGIGHFASPTGCLQAG